MSWKEVFSENMWRALEVFGRQKKREEQTWWGRMKDEENITREWKLTYWKKKQTTGNFSWSVVYSDPKLAKLERRRQTNFPQPRLRTIVCLGRTWDYVQHHSTQWEVSGKCFGFYLLEHILCKKVVRVGPCGNQILLFSFFPYCLEFAAISFKSIFRNHKWHRNVG